MLAHALGGSGMLALYTAGLFSAALSTLAGMVFIMSANVTRDVIKTLGAQDIGQKYARLWILPDRALPLPPLLVDPEETA